MNATLFNDQRATGLLHRVRQDLSVLSNDLRELVSHTTLQSLPNNARSLADEARRQLASGGAYAKNRFRGMSYSPKHESTGWVGGALVVGLVSMGLYAIYRNANHREPANIANAEAEPMPESLGI